MSNETDRDEGCLRGCLRSIIAGGALGVILGYFVARHFGGELANSNLFLFIRWGFGAAGFLSGILLWALGEGFYFYVLAKHKEEDSL